MSGQYLTSAAITNVHMNQFPDETIIAYVTEANAYYEDFCSMMGIDVESIHTPICQTSQRMLASYCVMRLAEDSIGTNAVSLAEGEDMYVEMRTQYKELVKHYQDQITPEMITGFVSNRTQRSVSSGKLFRS